MFLDLLYVFNVRTGNGVTNFVLHRRAMAQIVTS